MEVAELWRYPVKSMAGEGIPTAQVGERGIPGDRRLAVFEVAPNPKEKRLSARDLASLLRFRASLTGGRTQVGGPDLELVDWDDERVRQSLARVCHRELELRPMPDGAFDDSPILVVYMATPAALSDELGAEVDHGRFRANIYLSGEGTKAHGEPELVGREIRCGESLVLEVTKVTPRCSIITRNPKTWASWPQLLRQVVQAHDEVVGVYCRIKRTGLVSQGDRVEVL
jgi:hypothetical protein